MPFQSKVQARFMFAKHPKIAKRFAKHTPSMSKLPEKDPKMVLRAVHKKLSRRGK